MCLFKGLSGEVFSYCFWFFCFGVRVVYGLINIFSFGLYMGSDNRVFIGVM